MRWMGKRLKIRGRAKNSIDHPHGGREGCRLIGCIHPVTPWKKPRLGPKTNNLNMYIKAFTSI